MQVPYDPAITLLGIDFSGLGRIKFTQKPVRECLEQVSS